jgi:hypothetical protein
MKRSSNEKLKSLAFGDRYIHETFFSMSEGGIMTREVFRKTTKMVDLECQTVLGT